MRNNYMMTVDDVMEELGVKRSKAYITYFITFENLMNQIKAAHHENRLESV